MLNFAKQAHSAYNYRYKITYAFIAAPLCYNCPDAVKSFSECGNTTTCAQDEVNASTRVFPILPDYNLRSLPKGHAEVV